MIEDGAVIYAGAVISGRSASAEALWSAPILW